MKHFKRLFFPDILNHCYQNTFGGQLLFYNYSDYIVYFTILCTCATDEDVRLVAVCQMPDHVHNGVITSTVESLTRFFRRVNIMFANTDARLTNRVGHLFNSPFGSAPKTTSKKERTNVIYIGNNPVERKLTKRAIDYRWNYLAYYNNDHPFSEKLVIRRASPQMRKAVAAIKTLHNQNRPVTYELLQNLFRSLDRREGLQLIDYIITTYNVIDYQYSIDLFGSFDKMLQAMDSTTGSEYDIKEEFTGKSDLCYEEITRWLFSRLPIKDIHEIFAKSPEDRFDLAVEISSELGINLRQLAKFFRLSYKTI